MLDGTLLMLRQALTVLNKIAIAFVKGDPGFQLKECMIAPTYDALVHEVRYRYKVPKASQKLEIAEIDAVRPYRVSHSTFPYSSTYRPDERQPQG